MLFVSPQYRGQGLGRILLTHAVQTLVVQVLDVNEQNPQALAFYQHMAFAVFGRSPMDVQGNPFPLLHMRIKG